VTRFPWFKAPTTQMLAYRDDRIAHGRKAGEAEAFTEWMALLYSGRLDHLTLNAFARSLGWSRKRVVARLPGWWEGVEKEVRGTIGATWGQLGGNSGAAPEPTPSGTSERQGQLGGNSGATEGTPRAGVSKRSKKKEKTRTKPKRSVAPEVQRVWDAFRALPHGISYRSAPRKGWGVAERVKEHGEASMLLMLRWAAEGDGRAVWLRTGYLGRTLFRIDNCAEYVAFSKKWQADGAVVCLSASNDKALAAWSELMEIPEWRDSSRHRPPGQAWVMAPTEAEHGRRRASTVVVGWSKWCDVRGTARQREQYRDAWCAAYRKQPAAMAAK